MLAMVHKPPQQANVQQAPLGLLQTLSAQHGDPCQQAPLTTDSNGHVVLPLCGIAQGQAHCVAVILDDQVIAFGRQCAVGKGCLLALWHQVMGCAAAG